MGPPLPRGDPCLLELVQFEGAAHERHFGDGCHVLALQFLAVGCVGPELSVDRPDGLARFQREIALKHLRVPVVGAQRRASVAERQMCFHRIRLAKPTMRWATGFGIVPGMESENGMSRTARRRFSAEEKARIIGLYEESGLRVWSFAVERGLGSSIFSVGLASAGGPEKRVLWRLKLGPLRCTADIGWDLEEERGWKCQGASTSGRFACWPAL